jgi:hypothetical protein
MTIDQKITARLQELVEEGATILATRYDKSGYVGNIYFQDIGDHGVDSQRSNKWGINCLSLLGRVFGKDSDHYKRFDALFPEFGDYTPVKKAVGIMMGAKEDYEHGYLFETRILIEAEVFDDFLEQAEYLLQQGYYAPAAVIAGSVLEDGLRKLCACNGISLSQAPKLDAMNSELAKANVYTKLTQKNITAAADIRNSAAHGNWTAFTIDDVKNMLAQIRSFMAIFF